MTLLTGVLEDIRLCLSKLLEAEFHREHLKTLLNDFSTEKQLPFSKLMKLLRSAVSGLKVQCSDCWKINKHSDFQDLKGLLRI
jgi:hypothetical protein